MKCLLAFFLYIIATELNSYRNTIETEGQGENPEATLGFMKIFCKIFPLLTVLYFSFKNWICTSLFCPGAPRNQLFILGFMPFMMINLMLFGVYFLTDPALVFECWTNFPDEWGRLTCIFQMKRTYLYNLCRNIKEC